MNNYPFVSLILPIRNEGAYIKQTLQALAAQDYPAAFMEILFVDGMSTDNTRALISEFSRQHTALEIRLFDNPQQIVPTAMNIALRQARGEIIIRVDGHTLIAADYVRLCVAHLQKGDFDGVGGWVVTIGETPLAETIATAMSMPFGVGNSAMRVTQGKTIVGVDTIPFPAYTRKIIERVGLYDEELIRNQDDEFNYRIRKAGGKLLLSEEIKCQWYSRGTLKGLWRQYYQYGFYKVRVLQKHPLQMSLRQFVPPAFVLALIASALLGLATFLLHFAAVFLLLACLVPALYLCANLAASIYTAAKRGWKYLLLLPLVFAILHISYGLGFLAGLLKFWNRWGDKTGKIPPLEKHERS